MITLFEKYGGFSKVSAIVREFYKKILERSNISHYFINVDINKLIDHQTKFIAAAMGGSNEYKGKTIAAAHKYMKINQKDFDEVVKILIEVLEDADINDKDIETIALIVLNLKDEIVTE